MKLHLELQKPIILKSVGQNGPHFTADIDKLPTSAGIYVFGRSWGNQFEALYVGKAKSIKGRVKGHFNNLKLMTTHNLTPALQSTLALLCLPGRAQRCTQSTAIESNEHP